MIERLKYAVPGLAISLIAGALGHYFLGLEFWSATLIVALAIIAFSPFGKTKARSTTEPLTSAMGGKRTLATIAGLIGSLRNRELAFSGP